MLIDEDGVGWLLCEVFAAADAATADGTDIELVSFSLLFEGVEDAAGAAETDVLALLLVPAAVLEAAVVATERVEAAAEVAGEDTAMALDEEGMVGPFVDDDQVPVLLSNLRPWAF